MGKQVVGMVSGYSGLTQCDWLWKQTPQPCGVWKNIQIASQHQTPDFLLFYQFNFQKDLPDATPSGSVPVPPKTLKQKLKGQLKSMLQDSTEKTPPPPKVDPQALFRNVPPERSIFLMREPPLPEIVAKNKANYQTAQTYCQYVSGPDEFAPTPDYMPAIWYVNQEFEALNKGPVPPKDGMCSWVTSGINRTENHRRRLAFLRLLREQELSFDLYGKNLPKEMKPIGYLGNKLHGLAPYYYNLAIENYADNDWYVSEKLWDALLGWCLPIYYGGPAADKLLPPGSFLRLPSLDEKGCAFIKEVTATPDAWYEAKDAIAEARQIILHKLNLLNWLSEYIDKHG